MSNSLIKIFNCVVKQACCLFYLPDSQHLVFHHQIMDFMDILLGCDSHWRVACMLISSHDSLTHLNWRQHLSTISYEPVVSPKVSMNLSWAHLFFCMFLITAVCSACFILSIDDLPFRLGPMLFINRTRWSCVIFQYLFIQWVYCTTWPAEVHAGESHVTFTAFPLSFPCDAHIPHLSSLVRQSDLCSRPVHTWIKLRSV